MTLKQWLAEGKLKPHTTTQEEIGNLFKLVERDIQNASLEDLTPDWRFSIAYNAALNLATIPLLLFGYRTVPAKGGHHYITISALTETVGSGESKRVRFLNTCRNKRHTTTYDNAEFIPESAVEELLDAVKVFRQDLVAWIERNHPDFTP